jgi:outer membrane protein, multidrug efflux system
VNTINPIHRPLGIICLLTLGAALIVATGCSVKSKYSKPAIPSPETYRGEAPGETIPADAPSLGDQKWMEVFRDEQLQKLIQTALQQNFDVRIAATRILQAEAQVGITRADQFPTVAGTAQISTVRNARSFFPEFSASQGGIGLGVAWELDFWNKYRRATDAARANLMISEWARRAVTSTLVANLAASYFHLRELDLELEISQRTLASRQESLRLNQDLANRGLIAMVDVRQSEQLTYTAAASIPDIQRRIEQEENYISILLGNNPGAVPRGRALTEQPHAPGVPVGLPSSLLERRPDIQQAEQQLIAYNARIGVAKAAYFPQIALTGAGGVQSSALVRLFSGPAGWWNLVGGLAQPIFSGGKIKSGVRLAEAQQQEALLVYQQTIQQAFREVSDSLVAYRRNQETRKQQELLTQAAQESSRLADIRYRAGLTSYLEALTNQTNYFAAELGLAQSRLSELQALVQLYRALGGGWE